MEKLFLYARDGHEEALSTLLSQGASAKDRNEVGHTPLHYAALNGHIACIALLLEYGADINAQDMDGCTPLDYCILDATKASILQLSQQLPATPRKKSNLGDQRLGQPSVATP